MQVQVQVQVHVQVQVQVQVPDATFSICTPTRRSTHVYGCVMLSFWHASLLKGARVCLGGWVGA